MEKLGINCSSVSMEIAVDEDVGMVAAVSVRTEVDAGVGGAGSCVASVTTASETSGSRGDGEIVGEIDGDAEVSTVGVVVDVAVEDVGHGGNDVTVGRRETVGEDVGDATVEDA